MFGVQIDDDTNKNLRRLIWRSYLFFIVEIHLDDPAERL